MVAILVACRVLASSWSAVLQKRLASRGLPASLLFAAAISALALFVLPALAFEPMGELPLSFWAAVTTSALLDAPGNILLARSFHLTDLSIVGPLACYKPLAGLLFGALLLGETPTVSGMIGAAVIVTGSLLVAPGGGRGAWRALAALGADRGVRVRGVSIAMTALSAVFQKQAILAGSANQAFLGWSWLSAVAASLVWAAMRRGRHRDDLRMALRRRRELVSLGLLFLPLAWLSNQVLERIYVGYALALFQLSAVLNVFLGYLFFREAHLERRLAGASIMVAGATILLQ